jgi:hypothetical protein
MLCPGRIVSWKQGSVKGLDEIGIPPHKLAWAQSKTPGELVLYACLVLDSAPRRRKAQADIASQDGTQCADPQRTVAQNRDVMLAFLRCGQAHMTACLSCPI